MRTGQTFIHLFTSYPVANVAWSGLSDETKRWDDSSNMTQHSNPKLSGSRTRNRQFHLYKWPYHRRVWLSCQQVVTGIRLYLSRYQRSFFRSPGVKVTFQYFPVHSGPSGKKPSLQVHRKLPKLLSHQEFLSHAWVPASHFSRIWKKKRYSATGNRTPVSRVTGGDTHHYTIVELPICHRCSDMNSS